MPLGEERATYGKQIIAELSKKLTEHYGAGFDRISIYNYVRFYRMFPEIVDAARQQLLPWTHYRELIRVEDDVARQWYADESRREGWSSRTLHRNIGSQYYHRH